MNQSKLHKRIIIGALLGLIATISVILLTQTLLSSLFDGIEAKTLDWRYTQRLKRLYDERQGATIDDIIIVDIDNRSLEKLGRFEQWPRTYHAQLIDYLTKAGALAVGFDILFMEHDKKPSVDKAFVAATANSNIVYHSMAFSSANPDAFLYPMKTPPAGFDAKRFSLSLAPEVSEHFRTVDRMDGKFIELYNAAAGIGFANFTPDNDSVIRTMPMFLNFAGRQYMALSLAIVLGVLNADESNIKVIPGEEIVIQPPGGSAEDSFRIPINREGRILISYQGTFQTFRYISYYDVLMHRVPPETFEGRIVLVGTSAPGLSDIRPVPFQDAFPGVEIHANIIYDILSQEFITRQSKTLAFGNLILLAMLIAVIAMLLKPWQSALLGILLSGGYAFYATNIFASHAFWIDFIKPIITLFFAYLFVFMYRYVDEERNKRFIKNIFQYYLSASVVDELLRHPDKLKLGGDRRIATAFFSDIKNFTTVSEKLEPEALVRQLNEYLSVMTDIVLKYEGYLDKYEGDAIMAIFGVPVDQQDHARRACLSALEMQEVLVHLRKRWKSRGEPEFHVRIGINSGPMIAGNIGGENRFDYTVIGDAVNLASRLEGANKTYGTNIMISEFTKELLDDSLVLRELDMIRVKGKTKPVRIYEVMARNKSDLSNAQLILLDEFQKGLEAYRRRKWDEAIRFFKNALLAVPEDGPAKAYIERCNYFIKHSVPKEWDGVFEMKTK